MLDAVHGCTFDDYILAPQRSVLVSRDPTAIDLSCRLTKRITLKRPIVSANMDTVTRAPMAIVQAEEGGIGIIDRGFRPGEIEPQVREVEMVKRTQHGVISDPYSVDASATIGDALGLMARSRVGTLVVVDAANRLKGLLTERDVRFVDNGAARVSERMTPADQLVVHRVRWRWTKPSGSWSSGRSRSSRSWRRRPAAGPDHGEGSDPPAAPAVCHARRSGSPSRRRSDWRHRRLSRARRRAHPRRRGRLVIDIAHGHSIVMERAMREFRKRFSDVDMIAGNVATADGTRFLLERGADGIKVGIGPGGGCTTRMTTSFGVPQLQALVECRLAVGDSRAALIADGGIRRHGSLAEALVFGGDCAMLGSVFAGTEEAPGEIVHKSVLLPESQKTVKVPFKVLRGMASLEAIRDRLDVEDADTVELEAIGAEGMEISVPARGSARTIVREMIKHLCSSISYGGAGSLAELRSLFWANPKHYMIRQSASSRRESYER